MITRLNNTRPEPAAFSWDQVKHFPVLVTGKGQYILISSRTHGIILHDSEDHENVGYVLAQSELDADWNGYHIAQDAVTITFQNFAQEKP